LFVGSLTVFAQNSDMHYKYIIYKMTEISVETNKKVSETNISAELILDLQGKYILLKAKELDDWQMNVTYGEMKKVNNVNVLKVTIDDKNYQYGYFDNENKNIWFTPISEKGNFLVFDFSERKKID
jgi:hypothetical protein